MTNYPYYRALATVAGTALANGGSLKSFKAINRNAAIRYLQLFNSAGVPNAAAVPIDEFMIQATNQLLVGADFLGVMGVSFDAGITWAFSTSSGTYTAATAADHDFSAIVGD